MPIAALAHVANQYMPELVCEKDSQAVFYDPISEDMTNAQLSTLMLARVDS